MSELCFRRRWQKIRATVAAAGRWRRFKVHKFPLPGRSLLSYARRYRVYRCVSFTHLHVRSAWIVVFGDNADTWRHLSLSLCFPRHSYDTRPRKRLAKAVKLERTVWATCELIAWQFVTKAWLSCMALCVSLSPLSGQSVNQRQIQWQWQTFNLSSLAVSPCLSRTLRQSARLIRYA